MMRSHFFSPLMAVCLVFCDLPNAIQAQEVVKELTCRSVGTFDVTDGQIVHGPSTELWYLFYNGSELTRILAPFACRSADKRMEVGEHALLLQCDQMFQGNTQTMLGRIDRLTGAFFVSATSATNVLVQWGTCTSPDGFF